MAVALALFLAGCGGPVRTESTGGPADSSVADSGRVTAADSVDTAGTSETDSGSTTEPCDTGGNWYVDADGDGYGDPGHPTTCDDPRGVSGNDDDCDDAHATVNLGADELATSGRDDDCDGQGSFAFPSEVRAWTVNYPSPELYGYYFGYRVNMVDDLTDDGGADLVVTAWSVDHESKEYPGVAVVFQGASLTVGLASAADDAYAHLVADSWEDVRTVHDAGDIDGDGDIELLIGGQNRSNDGYVRLLRGPIPSGEIDLVSEAQSFWQYDTSLWEGVGPGDLDGDGLDDVVMADAGAADGEGRVWVLRGPTEHPSLDEADMILEGGELGRTIGGPVAAPGDLDGDGLDDFAIARSGGGAYLVTDYVPAQVAPGDVGAEVTYDPQAVGWNVDPVAAGDVNSDGHADMAFLRGDTRMMVLVYGPFDASIDVNLWEDWDVQLVSENNSVFDSYVEAATSLGDWDGDGQQDLAVANTLYVPVAHHDSCAYGTCDVIPGAVFLLAGPIESGTIDLEQVADRVDNPYDDDTDTTFGQTLAGGKDLDGDGFPDLAIGNYQYDTAYVLFGGGTW